MTWKNAAAGLPHGGAKSVLWGDPRMPVEHKQKLIRAFAHALRAESDYIFGPDMGTDETCMAWIKDETGRAAGLPAAVGGIPLDQVGATGWGLRHAAEAAAALRGMRLQGARVVVQGFGAVGKHAARFLAEQGAVLIAASDSQGTLLEPGGIDIAALIRLKQAGHSVLDYPAGQKLGVDAVIDVDCDLWIPAARPDVIGESNVGRLRTKLVLQGANIPFTPGAERTLHEQGVLVIPDFIANAGGVICAALEYRGATQAQAFETIAEKVRANVREVLQAMKERDCLPREAALAMAKRRVQEAMALRRYSIM
jgi:glutamate dehydrogenase (NAD(P)+)